MSAGKLAAGKQYVTGVVSDELAARARRFADKNDVSMSWVVRNAVAVYLDSERGSVMPRKQEAPRSMAIIPAGRQACSHCHVIHAVDEEDGQVVLRRHAAPVDERPSPATYAECAGTGRPGSGRVIQRMNLSVSARNML